MKGVLNKQPTILAGTNQASQAFDYTESAVLLEKGEGGAGEREREQREEGGAGIKQKTALA